MSDDAEERPWSVDFVGEGEFPPELDRVNWGAYGCSPFWLFAYGPRAWLVGFVMTFVAWILINTAALLFAREVYEPILQVVGVVMSVVFSLMTAGYAVTVNELVWRRERSAFDQAGGVPTAPIPMWRLRKSIRFWTRVFIAGLVVGFGSLAAATWADRSTLMDLRFGLGTLVMVSLFVYDRLRLRRAKLTKVSS